MHFVTIIDALLNDSPWARCKMDATALEKAELAFSGREQCVAYLDDLLRHKMFHRAKKIPVAEKSSKKDKKEKDKGIYYNFIMISILVIGKRQRLQFLYIINSNIIIRQVLMATKKEKVLPSPMRRATRTNLVQS